MINRIVSMSVFFVVVCSVEASAQSLSFQGLGDLAGGNYESQAWGVSADGSTIVGYSNSAFGTEAFRWTAASGITGLGDIDGGNFFSRAHAVSGDGSRIIGYGTYAGSASYTEAVHWTGTAGPTGTGDLPWNPPIHSAAQGVSDDGEVIVGMGQTSISSIDSGLHAFRWTASGGMQDLGLMPGMTWIGARTYANGTSADGSVVVGTGLNVAFNDEAWIWTQAGGMVGLGDLSGGSFQSEAWAVSADGLTVVGRGQSASGREAFVWTEAGGMVGLSYSPEGSGSYSCAFDVTADGVLVVGSYNNLEFNQRAFLWDDGHGMRDLTTILTDSGVDLSGWTLEVATGISADGTVIVGRGYNPSGQIEAWVATIPEPATLSLLALGLGALAIRRRGRRLKPPMVACQSQHADRAVEWTHCLSAVGAKVVRPNLGGGGHSSGNADDPGR